MSLDEQIEQIAIRIANKVVDARLSKQPKSEENEEAKALRRELDIIKAQENCTVNQAAKLLCCSPSHLRKLVQKAKQGKSKNPIPFGDLEGVITFEPMKLLLWKDGKLYQTDTTEQSNTKVILKAVK